MATVKETKTNNYLNDRQTYDLVTWLKGNQVPLKAHSATMLRCAEMATNDLGFLVTEGNIEGKLKQFPECRWKPAKTESALERLREVEASCKALTARLGCLEAELAALTIEKTNGNGRLFEVTR